MLVGAFNHEMALVSKMQNAIDSTGRQPNFNHQPPPLEVAPHVASCAVALLSLESTDMAATNTNSVAYFQSPVVVAIGTKESRAKS